MAFSDKEAAEALIKVIGQSRWEDVVLARGFLKVIQGGSEDEAAREMYEQGPYTLGRSRLILQNARQKGFLALQSASTSALLLKHQ